jgi:hypothetical protein
VRDISLTDVSADAQLTAFSDVQAVSARGTSVLSAGGRSVRFSNMASYGLHIGRHASARTEVGALGGSTGAQSVLVMYSNADGTDGATSGSTTGQVGSTGASLDVSGVKATLSSGTTSGSTLSTGSSSAPTIATDKPDYQPGDTVTFTGTGFAAGDTVTITVHEDPTWSYPDRQFVSVADGNGSFTNRDMVVDKQDLGVTFTATAVAVPSGLVAQTVFTDGNAASVSGTVTDASNNSPLAGVTVTCSAGCNGTFTTTTDASGNYVFDSSTQKLSFGGNGPTTLTLSFAKSGYQTGSIPVANVINTGTLSGKNIALTPSQATPTFTFDLSSLSKTYGDAAFSVAGSPFLTTNSDGAVSFALGTGSVGCTVSSAGLVTITSAAIGSNKCVIAASVAASTNFFAAGPATQSFNIARATATISVTPYSVSYDGAAHTATGTAAGVGGADLSANLTLTGTTHTNAATYGSDAWTFAGGTNYNDANGTVSDEIKKVTLTVTAPSFTLTYGDPVPSPITPGITGFVNAENTSALTTAPTCTTTYTPTSNAGSAQTTSCSGGAATNYGFSYAGGTVTVGKATATVHVTGYSVDYDGAAHTATGTATGVGGADLSSQLSLTGSTHTNAGTYTDTWNFGGGTNYIDASSTVADEIKKAVSTTVVTCTVGPFSYTGAAQTPCSVAVTGAGGLNLASTPSYSNNTDAGTATASYTFSGDANHNGSSDSKTFTIGKATSTTTVTCTPGPFTYDGTAQTPCSVTVTGAGGLSDKPTPTYTNNTAAGTATVSYAFAGDANHDGSSDSKTFVIQKAASTTTLSCPASVTYTGSVLEPCTASATGAGNLTVSVTPVSYTNNTNVGTAGASATYGGDANHDGSTGTGTFTIAKASSSTVITCPSSVTYNGAAQTPCTVAVTGAGGLTQTPTASYTNNTNAGTATASYTFAGDANHDGSTDSKTFTIAQATSSTAVSCPVSVTYDGTAQTPCSVAVTGAGGLSLTPTPAYANNTNAGTASASYTYAGDANHLGSTDSKTFEIKKAVSVTTVSCTAGPFTYDGTAQTPCSVTVTGVGSLSLTPSPIYVNNVNAGTATASYTYAGDANHDGSNGSQTFTIGKAASITAVTCGAGPFTYTASPQTPCSASVTGAGGLNLNPAPSYSDNTNAGTATASYSYTGDDNHTGSSDSKTFTIGKASSVTVVSCPAGPFTYDGTAQTPCSVSVTGIGGLSLTPSATYSNNTNAGTATASYAFAGDANHMASNDSKTFDIKKASSSTTVSCPASATFTGSALEPCTATATGAGSLSVPVTPVTYTMNTNAGTAGANATYAGDANHDGSTGSASFTIARASSATVVTCPASVTYNGAAQTPCTVAVTGAGGLSQTPTPTYSNNVNAGTASASYTFAGDANHESSSDSKNFGIAKALQSLSWATPAPILYGTALSAAQLNATVSGVPGGSPAGALTYSPAAGTVLDAGTQTLTVNAAETSNYKPASTTVSLVVNPASATITLTSLVQAYNGTARAPLYATNPQGLPVALTYTQNGQAVTPIDIGVYAVHAVVTNPNYVGSDDELFVIYDASAGFVTGGGWIDSPTGAYAANPALTGKANFGFVSKYQKGSNVPTGNTEFQFQAGNLNFKSTSFQWLVISSTTQAQFKGTGTINGQGTYNFLVTAIDGDNFAGANKKSDAFRIKITDAAGNVVYDNMLGADETSAAAQNISGGSIQIQSK